MNWAVRSTPFPAICPFKSVFFFFLVRGDQCLLRAAQQCQEQSLSLEKVCPTVIGASSRKMFNLHNLLEVGLSLYVSVSSSNLKLFDRMSMKLPAPAADRRSGCGSWKLSMTLLLRARRRSVCNRLALAFTRVFGQAHESCAHAVQNNNTGNSSSPIVVLQCLSIMLGPSSTSDAASHFRHRSIFLSAMRFFSFERFKTSRMQQTLLVDLYLENCSISFLDFPSASLWQINVKNGKFLVESDKRFLRYAEKGADGSTLKTCKSKTVR